MQHDRHTQDMVVRGTSKPMGDLAGRAAPQQVWMPCRAAIVCRSINKRHHTHDAIQLNSNAMQVHSLSRCANIVATTLFANLDSECTCIAMEFSCTASWSWRRRDMAWVGSTAEPLEAECTGTGIQRCSSLSMQHWGCCRKRVVSLLLS